MSKNITEKIIGAVLSPLTRLISYFIPIDSTDELKKDLENDGVIQQELNQMTGYLLEKSGGGGRCVALGSGVCHLFNHIDFNKLVKTSVTTTEQDVEITEQLPNNDVEITEQTLNNL